MKRPDVCRLVFLCAAGDWQVQVAPRARSDLGGANDTLREVADAHRVHVFEDHTEAEREAMREALIRMGASVDMTRRRGDGQASAFMTGVPVPRWWVDR